MQRPLADAYGRVATDLRVSLTDRCNLRCSYCMPAEGLDWLPARRGAHRRRGGAADHDRRRAPRRPRGAVHRRRAAGTPRPGRHRRAAPARSADDLELSITTNALGLERNARALAAAGPRPGQHQPRHRRPETLPHDHPARPARRRARGGLEAAARRRARPGQDQRRAAARRQRRPGAASCSAGPSTTSYELRFIEQMPLDAQHDWHREQMVTAEEIFEKLARRVHAHPGRASRAAARRPSCSWSTAARRRSA